MPGRLTGRTVVTTRDEPGRLDDLLAAEGATVVHLPLIEIAEPADGGRALRSALAGLATADWLVVTSRHGARRCGSAVAAAPGVHLAAVGAATAAELATTAGRGVDVVPERQTATDLLAAFPPPAAPGARALVAQADRADTTVADGLARLGYRVEAVIAYRTRLRLPTASERAAALGADAVAFASGSAVTAWAGSIGNELPPVVVAIGPATASVVSQVFLKMCAQAADHSVEGLADAVVQALTAST